MLWQEQRSSIPLLSCAISICHQWVGPLAVGLYQVLNHSNIWRWQVQHACCAVLSADYMNKPTFLNNFWEGFKEVLGPKHVIRSLDK